MGGSFTGVIWWFGWGFSWGGGYRNLGFMMDYWLWLVTEYYMFPVSFSSSWLSQPKVFFNSFYSYYRLPHTIHGYTSLHIPRIFGNYIL